MVNRNRLPIALVSAGAVLAVTLLGFDLATVLGFGLAGLLLVAAA